MISTRWESMCLFIPIKNQVFTRSSRSRLHLLPYYYQRSDKARRGTIKNNLCAHPWLDSHERLSGEAPLEVCAIYPRNGGMTVGLFQTSSKQNQCWIVPGLGGKNLLTNRADQACKIQTLAKNDSRIQLLRYELWRRNPLHLVRM